MFCGAPLWEWGFNTKFRTKDSRIQWFYLPHLSLESLTPFYLQAPEKEVIPGLVMRAIPPLAG